MTSEIFCWSIKWGESTISIFNQASKIHIIDFGAHLRHFNRYVDGASLRRVAGEVKGLITLNNTSEVDAVITHLHYDHYSLIPFIADRINVVYIPCIPEKPPEVRRCMLYLFAIYDIALKALSGKEVLDEIAKKASYAQCLYRGKRIDIDRFTQACVIWPPKIVPSDVAEKILPKLKRRYNEAKELLKKIRPEGCEAEVEKKASELDKIHRILGNNIESEEIEDKGISCKELTGLTGRGLVPFVYGANEVKLDREEETIQDLMLLLNIIHDATNDFSLVLEYRHLGAPTMVIPGDNFDDVLNYIGLMDGLKGTKRTVVFMRGAHHGTSYGKYLSGFKAVVTWLSHIPGTIYRAECLRNSYHVVTARTARMLNVFISDPVGTCLHINMYHENEDHEVYWHDNVVFL
jgi:hypothetical protein